ncbi:terminase small subunit [Pseudomonas aeruginosa]|uniref:terminase small subunit n=1 Tax=Pseudomonas aeruginosa TaxID=287 RepID=UPI00106A682C|nr:terminase small subunit [Pseudomonas aeruginosa]EIW4146872.1 terminase small subunit [Pseudomonas aeruginosa]EKU5853202.1 terminase small subunit [Pseudomonas aeruginosa]WGX53755.1 terminase small subunit [Pseudomonas aeruginosa]HDU8808053.1 terminase small subunit [Pseudomonas aeruginosa]
MAQNETTRQPGWLNKSEMAKSLGISPQAFDKWGVEPVAKIGREAFFRVQDVVQNRVDHATRKQQPEWRDEEGLDPLAEKKLLQERLRLTTAQADGQEQKNQVAARTLIPVPFVTFALAKIAAKIGSKLETVCKTVRSRIPDAPPVVLEAFEREIALARNLAVEFADDIPEILDEYAATLDE